MHTHSHSLTLTTHTTNYVRDIQNGDREPRWEAVYGEALTVQLCDACRCSAVQEELLQRNAIRFYTFIR